MAQGGVNGNDMNTGRGLAWRRVRVEEITPNGITAICMDLDYGQPFNVPVLPNGSKGGLPKPGETWLVDKKFGYWTFAAVLSWTPPTITGTTDAIPALTSLIEALAAQGFIVDQTDHATRIRATHTHTHTDPQGGSTGTDTL